MTESKFREARADDVEFLARAIEATAVLTFGRSATPEEAARRRARLCDGIERGELTVADEDGRIQGYCWVSDDVHCPRILDVFVVEQRRGSGLADDLLGRALSRSLDAGARMARLAIADRNGRSLRFFTSRGAEAVGDASPDGLRDYDLPLPPGPASP